MSSRQIKYLRQQLEAKKPKKEENLDDVDPIDLPSNDSPDFSVLLAETSGESQESGQEPPPQIASPPPPLPPPPKRKQKKEKKSAFDEEVEFASLIDASNKVKSEKEAAKNSFSMQSLNIIRELKSIVGSSKYDECLKLPKSSAPIRFMNRLHKWPAVIPQYFNFVQYTTNSDDNSPNYKVELTEYGKEQSSIYKALSRINDAQGILELGASAHFSPPVLPFLCQSLLFQREFESATEVVLRGLYVLQQSLPSNFVPLKSKLLPSEGRKDFLDLIAFVARFAFRRCCFETSGNLWKFGTYLTNDDPSNFLLLAAVPALYANDEKFILDILNSDRMWRDIPVKFLPDWSLVKAIIKLPDDIEDLSNEIARWSFFFTDLGLTASDIQVPPFLSSLGSAFRRRVAKYFEKPELESMLETCAIVAQDIDMSEEHAMILSFWMGVNAEDVEVGDMVEEFVMPTG